MKEIIKNQNAYINSLSKETKLSIKEITQMINKKTNVYLSAKQTMEMGIVDRIV